MKKNKTLQELFSFPGFRASKQLYGKFGDPKARVIVLTRRKKLRSVLVAVNVIKVIMIARRANRVIWMQRTIDFMCAMKDDEFFAQGARACV